MLALKTRICFAGDAEGTGGSDNTEDTGSNRNNNNHTFNNVTTLDPVVVTADRDDVDNDDSSSSSEDGEHDGDKGDISFSDYARNLEIEIRKTNFDSKFYSTNGAGLANSIAAQLDEVISKIYDMNPSKNTVAGKVGLRVASVSVPAIVAILDGIQQYSKSKNITDSVSFAASGLIGTIAVAEIVGAVLGGVTAATLAAVGFTAVAPAAIAVGTAVVVGQVIGGIIGGIVGQAAYSAAQEIANDIASKAAHDQNINQEEKEYMNSMTVDVSKTIGAGDISNHGFNGFSGMALPVLVDLGDGIHLTEDSGAAYNWGEDGKRVATGWASATTGILAYDANNDGAISGRGELAFADYVEGAQTDLEGLKHFDSNGDGVFDGKDAAWGSFKVWVDADQNGVSDEGELRSLDEADVAAIELKEQRHDKTLGANVHQGTGRYTTKDGTTRTAVSVAFGVDWAKVIEGATGIDLTSGREVKTTALNTASWKITINDPGPLTPAMALAAFAAAGSAAAGQPASLVYEGSTFTRDAKGAITVAASVLASHGVIAPQNQTSSKTVGAGDIVSDQIDLSGLAGLNPLLPSVELSVQSAGAYPVVSTAGRTTVLFDGPATGAVGVAGAAPTPSVADRKEISLFTGTDSALTLGLEALGGGAGMRVLSVGGGTGGSVSVEADGQVRFTPTSGYTGTGSFEVLLTDASGTVIATQARVTVLPTATGTGVTGGTGVTTTSTATGTTTVEEIGLTTTSTVPSTTTGTGIGTGTTGTGTTGTTGGGGTGIGTSTGTGTTGGAGTTTGTTSGTTTGTTLVTATLSTETAAEAGSGSGTGSGTVAGGETVIPGYAGSSGGTADPVTPPPPPAPPPPPGVCFSAEQLVQAGLGGAAGTLTVSAVAGASVGTVALNADGSLQYVAPPGHTGAVTLTVTLSDGHGGSFTLPVTVDSATGAALAPVPPPVAVTPVDSVAAIDDLGGGDDGVTGTEDRGLSFTAVDLLANDPADPDAAAPTLAHVHSAVGGTVSLAADGGVRFVPDADYNGAAGFSYDSTDAEGTVTTHRVTVDLAAVNDAPVVDTTPVAGTEDMLLTLSAADLAGRIRDVDGDAVTVTEVTALLGGTAALGAAGEVLFTPHENFNGTGLIRLTVDDGNGGVVTSVQSLAIAGVNDAPTAADQAAAGVEDVSRVFTAADLLAGAGDVDGDVLSVTAVANAVGGTARVEADGTVTFTPDADYNGAAGFDYTVSDGQGGTATARVDLTLAAVNDAPTGGATLATDEDTALTVDLAAIRAGDSDVEGDAFTYEGITTVRNGTLVENGDGTVTFTPDADFHGQAGFDYKLVDDQGAEGVGRVVIDVAPVNDAPVLADHAGTLAEDTPVQLSAAALLAGSHDVDGDVLSVTGVSGATGGTVSLDAEGRVLFTPDADYSGAAGFDYTVSDGQGGTGTAHVALDITAVNDAPRSLADLATFDEDTSLTVRIADLLANDYDVEGDSFDFVPVFTASHGAVTDNGDGTVTFTPDADYFGTAGFTYRLTDSEGASADIEVALTVTGVNDAPVAGDDAFSFDEDTVAVFSKAALFANDIDVDGDPLTIASVQDAVGGTAVLTAGGDVRFTPFADYNGAGGFTYTVDDGNGGQASAAVVLDIRAVNDAPRMTGVTYAATEEVPLTLDPARILADAAAHDVDGDVFGFTGITGVTGGTVTAEADGSLTFTPTENFFGQAEITYTATDAQGATGTGHVTLDVANVQDAPVAGNDGFALQEDQNAQFTHAALTGNDTDADGDPLTIVSVDNVAGGTATVSGGGVFFSPTADYNTDGGGSAGFDYTVSDGHGNTSTARVDLTIAAVNDAPRLQADWLGSALEEQPITVSAAALMSNDHDPEGDALTFLGVSGASGGTVSRAGDTITFTPHANFYGTASFTYHVADSAGAVSSATAAYQVINVNDAPVAAGETVYGQEDEVLYVAAPLLTQNDYDPDGDALSIVSAYGAMHGSVYADGSGVVYVPQANYYGMDQFTYTISDGKGGTASATAYLNIASVNDLPYGAGEQLSPMLQGSTLHQSFASLLANDHDPDGDVLTILSASSSYGTASISGTTVVFTPRANVTGPASFDYVVSDGNGGTITETARIDVISTNRAPTITGTTVTRTPGDLGPDATYFGGFVTATDPDNDPLNIQVGTNPSFGFLVASTYDGQHGWLWNTNGQAGTANFQLKIVDTGGLYATADMSFTATAVAPIVLDLAGTGLNLLSSTDSGMSAQVFDSAAIGTTGWIGAGNAFLALDDDGDGSISAKDIVFTDDAPGAATDMDAVQQVYDTSGDGALDAADSRYGDFYLWQDRNQDGIADTEEVQALADAGIASIGLTGARDDQAVNGSIVHRVTEFTRTDGSTGTAADVSLGTMVVTTGIEVTPNPVSTSTVLHSIPNAVPTAPAEAAQQVTLTSVAVDPEQAASAGTPEAETPETVSADASAATGTGKATETAASTASVDLAASLANQADLLRQAMAAFDPAPAVAVAASATDLLTPAATLAANPISAGDQGDTKLAA